jgi:hypothetical protein
VLTKVAFLTVDKRDLLKCRTDPEQQRDVFYFSPNVQLLSVEAFSLLDEENYNIFANSIALPKFVGTKKWEIINNTFPQSINLSDLPCIEYGMRYFDTPQKNSQKLFGIRSSSSVSIALKPHSSIDNYLVHFSPFENEIIYRTFAYKRMRDDQYRNHVDLSQKQGVQPLPEMLWEEEFDKAVREVTIANCKEKAANFNVHKTLHSGVYIFFMDKYDLEDTIISALYPAADLFTSSIMFGLTEMDFTFANVRTIQADSKYKVGRETIGFASYDGSVQLKAIELNGICCQDINVTQINYIISTQRRTIFIYAQVAADREFREVANILSNIRIKID